MSSRRILFVCQTAAGESLRSAQAIAKLDDVTLLGIVSDVRDTEQLLAAARGYENVTMIVTAQETLLLPVAEANEALAVRSMSSETVKRTLDKSQLKATLKQAGIKTPRDQIITMPEDAQRFVIEVGFPIIIKPVGGSGALTTFQIHDEEQLAQVLQLIQPPVIAEAFVSGQELCFDTITIGNKPQFYSLCEYNPSILYALQNPETQWRCIMPRRIDDKYQEFITQGLAAVRALQVGNAMTHMEGFLNGGFIDATLRPAGARIAPMFGFACDVDPYRVWARIVVDGCFDGPLERKFNVGTIFLRGTGSGLVEHVTGVDTVCEELGNALVEAHWPKVGATKSPTYTGDGFVTVRHADIGVVEEALNLIERTVKITYSYAKPESSIENAERLRNYRSLNKPAWEATL
jgi:ribosomal protein S6-L-glutamate ligase RimK-like protein